MSYTLPFRPGSASNSGAQQPAGNGTQAPQNTPAGGGTPANQSNAQSGPPANFTWVIRGASRATWFDGMTDDGRHGWSYGYVGWDFMNRNPVHPLDPDDPINHHLYIDKFHNGSEELHLGHKEAYNACHAHKDAGPWRQGKGVKVTFVGLSNEVLKVERWDCVVPDSMTPRTTEAESN